MYDRNNPITYSDPTGYEGVGDALRLPAFSNLGQTLAAVGAAITTAAVTAARFAAAGISRATPVGFATVAVFTPVEANANEHSHFEQDERAAGLRENGTNPAQDNR